MSNLLEAVAETMGEIVCGVDFPSIPRSKVRLLLLGNSKGREVPHLRVTALDILVHAQKGSLRLVLTIAHITKLLEAHLHVLFRMLAAISWQGASFTAPLHFDFSFGAVADVGFT